MVQFETSEVTTEMPTKIFSLLQACCDIHCSKI